MPTAAKKAPAKKPAAKKPATKTASKAAPKAATKKAAPKKSSSAKVGGLTEAKLIRMPEKDYMNDAQVEFFRQRLLDMRQEMLERETHSKEELTHNDHIPDPVDRATAEEEHWLDLRLRERESMLLRKIDKALRRIETGEYGWCEETGDAIGLPRLLARPTAEVSIEAKSRSEHIEANYRDR